MFFNFMSIVAVGKSYPFRDINCSNSLLYVIIMGVLYFYTLVILVILIISTRRKMLVQDLKCWNIDPCLPEVGGCLEAEGNIASSLIHDNLAVNLDKCA